MQKTKDLAILTQAPQRNRREFRCFEWVTSSCSTKGPNQVALVKIPVISEKRSKGIEMFDINTYMFSALLQFSAIFFFYQKVFMYFY